MVWPRDRPPPLFNPFHRARPEVLPARAPASDPQPAVRSTRQPIRMHFNKTAQAHTPALTYTSTQSTPAVPASARSTQSPSAPSASGPLHPGKHKKPMDDRVHLACANDLKCRTIRELKDLLAFHRITPAVPPIEKQDYIEALLAASVQLPVTIGGCVQEGPSSNDGRAVSRSVSPRGARGRSRSASADNEGRSRRCSASRQAERQLKRLSPGVYLETVDAAGGSGRWMSMSWRERWAFYDKTQEKKVHHRREPTGVQKETLATRPKAAPKRPDSTTSSQTPTESQPETKSSAPAQRPVPKAAARRPDDFQQRENKLPIDSSATEQRLSKESESETAPNTPAPVSRRPVPKKAAGRPTDYLHREPILAVDSTTTEQQMPGDCESETAPSMPAPVPRRAVPKATVRCPDDLQRREGIPPEDSSRRAQQPATESTTETAASTPEQVSQRAVPKKAPRRPGGLSAASRAASSAAPQQCQTSQPSNTGQPSASSSPASTPSDALDCAAVLGKYPAHDLQTAVEAVGGLEKWRRMSDRERLNAVARVFSARETELDELMQSATVEKKSNASVTRLTELKSGACSSGKRRPSSIDSMIEAGETSLRDSPLVDMRRPEKDPAEDKKRPSSVLKAPEFKSGHCFAGEKRRPSSIPEAEYEEKEERFCESIAEAEYEEKEEWFTESCAAEIQRPPYLSEAMAQSGESPALTETRPSSVADIDARSGASAAAQKQRPSSALGIGEVTSEESLVADRRRPSSASQAEEVWSGRSTQRHISMSYVEEVWSEVSAVEVKRPSSMPQAAEDWSEISALGKRPSSVLDAEEVDEDWSEVDEDWSEVDEDWSIESPPASIHRPSSAPHEKVGFGSFASENKKPPFKPEAEEVWWSEAPAAQFRRPSRSLDEGLKHPGLAEIPKPKRRPDPAPTNSRSRFLAKCAPGSPAAKAAAVAQAASLCSPPGGKSIPEEELHQQGLSQRDEKRPLPRPRPLQLNSEAPAAKKRRLPMRRARETPSKASLPSEKRPSAAMPSSAEPTMIDRGQSELEPCGAGDKQWEPEEEDAPDQNAEIAPRPAPTKVRQLDRPGFEAAIQWLNTLSRSDDDVAVPVLEKLLRAQPEWSLLRKVDWEAALAPQLHMTEGRRRSLAAAIVDRWTRLRNAEENNVLNVEAQPPPKKVRTGGGPSGRKVIQIERLIGTVVDWKGKFGWVKPEAEIDHPKARQKGDVYLALEDVEEEFEGVGAVVSFVLYEDAQGLGAMQAMPEIAVPHAAELEQRCEQLLEF